MMIYLSIYDLSQSRPELEFTATKIKYENHEFSICLIPIQSIDELLILSVANEAFLSYFFASKSLISPLPIQVPYRNP